MRDAYWARLAEHLAEAPQAVDVLIIGDLNAAPPQRDEHNQFVVGEKGIAQDPWVVPQEGANQDPERRREEEEDRDLVVNNTRLTEDMCKE